MVMSFLRAVFTMSAVSSYPSFGASSVAVQRELSKSSEMRFVFIFRPLIHFLLRVVVALVRICIDLSRLAIINGQKTFSSNCDL